MRHGSDGAQAVEHRRQHVRRAATAGHRRGARDLERRVDPVVAPGREVDHTLASPDLAPARGERDPRRLSRHQGLEADLVQQDRLDELALDPRRRHPDERLACEADGSLR